MPLIIDNPSPETVYDAIKDWTGPDKAKLREYLATEPETLEEEEAAWYAASQRAAQRFFEEEEA